MKTRIDSMDQYDQIMSNSPCISQHEDLQNCYMEKKDWRECKREMDLFKSCFKKSRITCNK